MLSVSQSAGLLGVTPTRVRALIASGELKATKVGRAWALREEDVVQRLSEHRRAGRPASIDSVRKAADPMQDTSALSEGHALYEACKSYFRYRPAHEQLSAARSREEAAFYVTMADFFLQQRQRELIDQGVF